MLDLNAGVLHVRQTLTRVRNHDAKKGDEKTGLAFQEPKTAYSRRTVPFPEACSTALNTIRLGKQKSGYSWDRRFRILAWCFVARRQAD